MSFAMENILAIPPSLLIPTRENNSVLKIENTESVLTTTTTTKLLLPAPQLISYLPAHVLGATSTKSPILYMLSWMSVVSELPSAVEPLSASSCGLPSSTLLLGSSPLGIAVPSM